MIELIDLRGGEGEGEGGGRGRGRGDGSAWRCLRWRLSSAISSWRKARRSSFNSGLPFSIQSSI